MYSWKPPWKFSPLNLDASQVIKARKRLKWSQRDLAKVSQLSLASIVGFETRTKRTTATAKGDMILALETAGIDLFRIRKDTALINTEIEANTSPLRRIVPKTDSAQQLAIDLQDMQRRAVALGLVDTAKALGDAASHIQRSLR